MSRIRTRAFVEQALKMSSSYYMDPASSWYNVIVNRETTIDSLNSWYAWKRVRENPLSKGYTIGVDVGGDFTSVKSTGRLITDETHTLRAWPHQGNYLYNFSGHIIPWYLSFAGSIKPDVEIRVPMEIGLNVSALDYKQHPQHWNSVEDTDEELAMLGAKLISELSPTAPHNSVYATLTELRREGIPTPFTNLFQGGKSGPQRIGGEYLNYQFGIAPTVSDVKSLLKTVRDADMLWKQYLRDSGRLVRRRFDMDPEITTVTDTIAQPSYAVPHGTSSYHWSSIGPVHITTKRVVKRSFSAAYMYYVDESSLSGMEGWLQRADHLYGLAPTLSDMYNLTAWTWLFDWFTNTGDVVDNISLYLEDPFLVRWAYIMEEQTVTRQITQTNVTNEGKSIRSEVHLTMNSKKRRRINPLHWGVTEEALDARQLSILAALGMTKGRNPGTM